LQSFINQGFNACQTKQSNKERYNPAGVNIPKSCQEKSDKWLVML
tara:strand:- start:2487 stop:2621 length:135 start_codon:yes stop_codon:yes gene_type:complete